MRVVLASGNAGKLKELRALLAPLGIELAAQGELGLEGAPETACTFVENALAKARHASEGAGLPAIADDSGLAVSALNGAPGVHSARYAGPARDDGANNRKLIATLAGISDRRARFCCAMVYVDEPGDPVPVIAMGEWQGTIVDEARGENGFGYDPHFLVPELGLTSAELDPGLKNSLSHRGQAARTLLAALRRRHAQTDEP
ncbi:MAG: RdgB/HAM1 family non-canonical purine NTP pyrophosphatase [Gammaproteobacteria bacterium]|nr:RdgB/HAM1 family non-canonical purine NTP pyrophosphatase [Gammaproteobacteria bacterium]